MSTTKQQEQEIIIPEFNYIQNIVSDTYINVLNENNPLLFDGETVYFLFQPCNEPHLLFVGKGKILTTISNDNFHQTFVIQFDEIIEDSTIKFETIYNKKYTFQTMNGKTRKLIQVQKYLNKYFFVNKLNHENFIKVDTFFVNQSLSDIKQIRNKFLEITKSVLVSQIADIDKYMNNEHSQS